MRREGRIPVITVGINSFYEKHVLEAHRHLFDKKWREATKLPVTPVLRSSPETVLISYEPFVVKSETLDLPIEEEADLAEVFSDVVKLGLQTVQQLGVTPGPFEFKPVGASVEQVYVVKVQSKGKMYTVRITHDTNGQYIPYCPELVPHLEQTIKRLREEVAIKAQLVHAERSRATKIKLVGWADAELVLDAEMRPIEDDWVELRCPAYPKLPFVTIGPSQSKAEANLRLNLAGYLCGLHKKYRQGLLFGHEENYYDALCLLFGELPPDRDK